MTEHRWSKFWWADYEGDDALRVVSLAAQGLWMRMLCVMHKGTPYGHLTINGRAPTPRQIAMMASANEREVVKLLAELEESGVFSTTDDGVIYSRRMVRDKAISDKSREDGKKGGNPTLKAPNRGGLTPPVNGGGYTLEAEADTDTEADILPPVCPPSVAPRAASPTHAKTGIRLPADWHPSVAMEGFAAGLGLNTDAVAAQFRDYWTAQPGQKGRKTDWEATWRNWCRREAERNPSRPAKTSQWSVEEQNAEIMRLVGRAPETIPPLMRLCR